MSKNGFQGLTKSLRSARELNLLGPYTGWQQRPHRNKEGKMRNLRVNYDTLIKVSRTLSKSKNPEEIIRTTVESIKAALDIKGCTLFLINRKSKKLEIAASTGLSAEYLKKGPVSTLRSIADSLKDGPIGVYDVNDDPRVQYPEAAKKEGIASILSVPIMIGDEAIGAIRVYTAEKWEFTLDDVNFVQALAQIAGILIEMTRLYQGQKDHLEALATMCESPAL
jgi:GAF domain-containing protein